MRDLDPARVRRVWMNSKFTTEEVCAILLVSNSELRRLARMCRLPKRHFVQRNEEVNDEPAPNVKLEHERRAKECRERHYAKRRAEDKNNTSSKVSKWRAGRPQRSD